MTSYVCEDHSVCSKLQLAICLHCQRRLCLEHITEHNKIILNSVTNISKDVQITFQQIKKESEKRRDVYNDIVTSLNQWKTEEQEKLQQVYDHHLQSIQSQHEILANAEVQLFEQLEKNALQPLEHLQNQQNANIEIVDQIQQIIQKVREDNTYLQWNLDTPIPPVDVAYYPFNHPSVLLPIESSKSEEDSNQRPTKKIVKKKLLGRSLHRLVTLFSNTIAKHIPQNKRNIRIFLKKQTGTFGVPNMVCSYLTAWHRKSKLHIKVLLLKRYISIIQEFMSYNKSDCDILFGIQTFFYYENIEEDKSEMMTTLLQFFFDYKCINKTMLFKWYKRIKNSRYEGLEQARELAKPFVQSFSRHPVGKISFDNTQTVSTPSGHFSSFEIKQEQISTAD